MNQIEFKERMVATGICSEGVLHDQESQYTFKFFSECTFEVPHEKIRAFWKAWDQNFWVDLDTFFNLGMTLGNTFCFYPVTQAQGGRCFSDTLNDIELGRVAHATAGAAKAEKKAWEAFKKNFPPAN